MAQMVKNPPLLRETWVQSLGWEDPLEEGHGYPLQYPCLENPCGQRSLAGYSPWGCRVGHTERLSTVYSRVLLPSVLEPSYDTKGSLYPLAATLSIPLPHPIPPALDNHYFTL